MMTSFIKEKCIDRLTTYCYKYKNCPKRGLYRGHLGVTPVYQCIFGSCAWWAKWFQRLEDIFLRLFHRGKKLTYFTNIKTLWIGAIWGITVFIIVSLWFETCRLGKYMYSYYIVGCYHHYVDDPLGENMCVYVWVFAFRRSSLLTFHVIGYLIELPSICKRFVMLLWWGLKKLWPKCKYMYILTNLLTYIKSSNGVL